MGKYLRDRLNAEALATTSKADRWTRGGEGVVVENPAKLSHKAPKVLLPLMGVGALFELLFALLMAILSLGGSILAIPQALLLSACWGLRGGCNVYILIRTVRKRQTSKKAKKKKIAEKP